MFYHLAKRIETNLVVKIFKLVNYGKAKKIREYLSED